MENLVAEAIVMEGISHTRPMTDEEKLRDELNQSIFQEQEELKNSAKERLEQSRLALLEKLGITEEEAKLLLS